MKETNIEIKNAKPCTIAAMEGSGWDAPNASMYKKDDRHVYVYDPEGHLPENCGTSLMAIKNKQRTYIYTVEAEEGFDCGKGSLCLCRILSAEPAALKFMTRLKSVDVMNGTARDFFRGTAGCGLTI